MSTLEVSPSEPLSGPRDHCIVNDFSIQVATVNGSGSQTANSVLMRAIFQMGIPVSGKNMFPSNIAGLPTWFTIRASKKGYVGRRKEVDFLVAMNPETAREDALNLESGAAVVYDETLKLNELRSDLHCYRSVRQTGDAGVPRGAPPQAGAEHDLHRRGGAASRD
jgi:2-oxoglutarate ferredoxin oxidoreductase subunit alpha